MNLNILKKYWKYSFVLIGALGGYAYYYFIGCNSGSCPITSNPYISIMYGAFMGLILAWNPSSKKKEEDNASENN